VPHPGLALAGYHLIRFHPTLSAGTVCDDLFSDVAAGVVCRQLGLGSSGVAIPGGTYGAGSGPIILDNVNCTGGEATLEQCPNSGSIKDCSHDEDVAVECESGTQAVVLSACGPYASLPNGPERTGGLH